MFQNAKVQEFKLTGDKPSVSYLAGLALSPKAADFMIIYTFLVANGMRTGFAASYAAQAVGTPPAPKLQSKT